MALLRSAVKTIATQGLRASTVMIARYAGVAEGTLFLYFSTKDVLLSAVFEHLLQDLEASLASLPPGLSSRQTAESIWNRYIDWGAADPDAYSTINQLLASDRLTAGQLRRAETLYPLPEVQACRRRFAGLTDREAWALSDATEKAIADTTVRLAVAQPQHAEAYKMAGFDMLWAAVTRGADHPGLSQRAGEYFTRGTRLSST
ncbi:TetR/AcrR family transcriptional regulator [Achromobacter sp. Marseille-Q0513]|uniref:TetR/AcrR family transcriptional regulator n=1 Tax=Achromobacter sp. Marseille-Q0513 TaxID=2829161 RepID=UPI001B98288E|nr:TetR/AcrR family transcriptional regulator [Achromobacter sp. Marseille-Q0513]MBR8652370.1 TetR/AcrR family transcriptional regulator [Achromobacter sp. Marseille-Q0513]